MYDYLEFTNASTFLRLGGSGGFGDHVKPGDLVITSGAVRGEGMTRAYLMRVTSRQPYEVVKAMVEAAERIRHPYHVGVTVSCDSDYVGGGRPGVGGYMQPWNTEHADIYNRAGCLNGDRESSAIITLAALFGRRGGSVALCRIICARENVLRQALVTIMRSMLFWKAAPSCTNGYGKEGQSILESQYGGR